ncbi:cell division protein ZapE [Pseudomonas entomophila]|uniref:cell division protein ZapE n=1 Tax=Pseudomonas sp. RIT-PI-S TaxID=3035295 RepID=UPI0021D86CA2
MAPEEALDVKAFFSARAERQGYTLGDSQVRVIDRLAVRAPLLNDPRSRLEGPPSLYLYGKVGRGKSWLLDGFYEAVELKGKRRLHFHGFFNDLHAGMFRHQGQEDALERTLDELLSGCRLLCFDEFHVHDIGDAMLIRRLFAALFARGVLLIVTSNYSPEGLLPNPLYHERFLPVIRLIEAEMEVLEVGGEQDYRAQPGSGSLQRFVTGAYVVNPTEQHYRALGLSEHALAILLQVGNRPLQARMSEGGRVAFSFAQLCEAPTAVMDYLTLCERYDEWVITDLPLLAGCSIAVQQRFINLVDVLYDRDKRLTVLSQYPLAEALAATAIDLMRSQSRLGQLRQPGGHE